VKPGDEIRQHLSQFAELEREGEVGEDDGGEHDLGDRYDLAEGAARLSTAARAPGEQHGATMRRSR